jgi:hypothetical protein
MIWLMENSSLTPRPFGALFCNIFSNEWQHLKFFKISSPHFCYFALIKSIEMFDYLFSSAEVLAAVRMIRAVAVSARCAVAKDWDMTAFAVHQRAATNFPHPLDSDNSHTWCSDNLWPWLQPTPCLVSLDKNCVPTQRLLKHLGADLPPAASLVTASTRALTLPSSSSNSADSQTVPAKPSSFSSTLASSLQQYQPQQRAPPPAIVVGSFCQAKSCHKPLSTSTDNSSVVLQCQDGHSTDRPILVDGFNGAIFLRQWSERINRLLSVKRAHWFTPVSVDACNNMLDMIKHVCGLTNAQVDSRRTSVFHCQV